MGRKLIVKNLANKVANIIPYQINTLYGQQADNLNSLSQNLTISMHKYAISHIIQRLKLTASYAQSAVLAATQVNQLKNLFIIHKNAQNDKKWISQDYNNKDLYQYFINAKICKANTPIISNQQSVSFPFIDVHVNRYQNIQVQFCNIEGETRREKMNGFKALAFQQAWDYSVGRHILDWRLHFGRIKIQDDMQEKLPKTASVFQQYSVQLKSLFRKYPKITQIPSQLSENQINWLQFRGSQDQISIEGDYLARIHKHYRKQMLILLQKLQHNII